MEIYSQVDPRWKDRFMGSSKLRVGTHGCFFCMLCTIYQVDPLIMLRRKELWDKNGNIYSDIFAKICGGERLPTTAVAPKEWCIGVTNKYAPNFPTHFVLVNPELKQQADPLDSPAQVETQDYSFFEYRRFTNTKFNSTETWQKQAERWAVDNAIIGSGWDAPDAPMSQVRVAAALKNFHDRFIS